MCGGAAQPSDRDGSRQMTLPSRSFNMVTPSIPPEGGKSIFSQHVQDGRWLPRSVSQRSRPSERDHSPAAAERFDERCWSRRSPGHQSRFDPLPQHLLRRPPDGFGRRFMRTPSFETHPNSCVSLSIAHARRTPRSDRTLSFSARNLITAICRLHQNVLKSVCCLLRCDE